MPPGRHSVAPLIRAAALLVDGGEAPCPERLRSDAEATRRNNAGWLHAPGVLGVGIGRRVCGGETLEELVLTVFVRHKQMPVDASSRVPKWIRIPGLKERVRTDVEPLGDLRPETNLARVRPIQPGYSVAHPKAAPGSIGCLLRERSTDELYILSNSHVLADSGVGRRDAWVLQPAAGDCSRTSRSRVAKLADWIPFRYSLALYNNEVDAAIAGPIDRDDATSFIKEIGVPAGIARASRVGGCVQKSGRTTGQTVGEVKHVGCRLSLEYKRRGRRGMHRVGFSGLVRCTSFTEGGDSGAVVLNRARRVVGLHVAGSRSSSFFCPIQSVIDAFDERGWDLEVVTTKSARRRPSTLPC